MGAEACPAFAALRPCGVSDSRGERRSSAPCASTYPQDERALPVQPNKVRLAGRDRQAPLRRVFDQGVGDIYLFLEKSPVRWWRSDSEPLQTPIHKALMFTDIREQSDECMTTASDRCLRCIRGRTQGGGDPGRSMNNQSSHMRHPTVTNRMSTAVLRRPTDGCSMPLADASEQRRRGRFNQFQVAWRPYPAPRPAIQSM